MGASLALLELGSAPREWLPGHLLGSHSVTHLGALKISLLKNAGVSDRNVQTEVWCPQKKDEW